jgi:pyruvate/2-oxoglutarate/acetoin dehydrogenase E1 component/TPP-dependent pyruvate/acetoin dehydrogenase alpha subunit
MSAQIAATETVGASTELMLSMLTTMRRIRVFEERMRDLFLAGKLPGFVHLYLGEEAIATGVCAALRTDDYIASTHRGHGHGIAKGASLHKMAAEIMGKKTGMCGGKGGSMHVADFSIGMLGCNGIVGGGLGLVAGAAFSAKHRGTDQVAVAFFGDGASSKGAFHEAVNWAAVKKLPAIFVCENNHYAQFTDPKFTVSVENIAQRAQGYGIPGEVVDGQDAVAVYAAARRAVDRARRGEGPTLLEMKTYRYSGHYVGDHERYRPREEVAAWRERDPIEMLEKRLADEGRATAERVQAIADAAAAEMDDAERFAFDSPQPDPSEAHADVFAPSLASPATGGPPVELTFGEATREAMRAAMAADPNVVVMGEDIHWGGNFGQFNGLYDEFGETRVVDMPISEGVIVSAALGAAITGLRPIISMSFVDFTLCAMDELINQVAKIRYMFGGQIRVPLVFRASDGAVRQAAAQHSQCLEVLFAHLPGLKVVAPSNVADAKGLLAAAIADGNPVVYLEHKIIGRQKGLTPSGEFAIPIGSAAVARPGRDVSVITYSLMTQVALEAAEQLAAEGIDVEVIDLRSLAPIDWDTIAASVRKNHRAVVFHEGYRQHGLGAEIAARISDELFDELDAPVGRVGSAHTPLPFSPPLENEILPNAERLMTEVRRVVGR